MLRFRRYRVFLVFAVIFVVLVVRLTKTSDWAYHPQVPDFEHPPPPKQDDYVGSLPVKTPPPADVKGEEIADSRHWQTRISASTKAEHSVTSTAVVLKSSPAAAVQTVPHIVLPDRKPLPPTKISGTDDPIENDIHAVGPPGRQEFPTFSAVPTTIYWERQVEHFPVPKESIIPLPTGKPAKLPQIQHNFNDETPDAKINREKRQEKVKEEFKRAWTGYKDNAWLHDELSPVSGKFRDPFCGWAATLVDTLDTLWIMGLQEEFEEAARAVDLIDFTTSPRADIPVFETTIRYLGGLLAAYDVSGGAYKNLLDKAVELADILLGAFDTPNRMPVLYYLWKPTFASQAHRASTRANLAELGSLSMEFTRLAQLTKEPRYYDAVARVTIALSEWQDRGTKVDGVFPDNVDASGCNISLPSTPLLPYESEDEPAINSAKPVEAPLGYQPDSPDPVREPKKAGVKDDPSGPGSLELQVLPGDTSKAKIVDGEDQVKTLGNSRRKRELGDEVAASNTSVITPTTDPITGLPLDLPAAKAKIGAIVGEWDCAKQGLESTSRYGLEKYSMGGGQDSTYEYFTKQYLLLGGQEEIYRKMYLKTIEGVRKWMLYRPMIPGDRDILFSGSVTTFGGQAQDLELSADVEHLTCFIGGMVGMGAKVFGLEGDLEIAKKLSDGCVWAYESTRSGIMPEGATVMPCKSAEHCTWNETAYWEYLDPMGAERDKAVEVYDLNKANEAAEVEAAKLAVPSHTRADGVASNNTSENDFNSTQSSKGSDILKKDEPVSLQKRQSSPVDDMPKPITHKFADDLPATKARVPKAQIAAEDATSAKSTLTASEKSYQDKIKQTEAELDSIVTTSGRQAEAPLTEAALSETTTQGDENMPDPLRPLNHTEYVKSRIKQETLPPGFVSIKSTKYILRPEAIESVWYMYRITGDASWQEKGWKMFESIINATSTKFGHSAVFDVTLEAPYQVDEMESFWLAETLKYFYLLYSTPETISLDEWVLNTEAHPFKRPS